MADFKVCLPREKKVLSNRFASKRISWQRVNFKNTELFLPGRATVSGVQPAAVVAAFQKFTSGSCFYYLFETGPLDVTQVTPKPPILLPRLSQSHNILDINIKSDWFMIIPTWLSDILPTNIHSDLCEKDLR